MKKVFGVALVGGLLLFFVLRYATADKRVATGADPASATTAAPVAPAVSVVPAAPQAPAVTPVDSVAADGAACARLSDLCSTSDQKVNVGDCQKQLLDARKMAGAGNVARSEECITEAKTCAAASGCLSGGVGMGAMGEFLKGLGGALSK